MTIAELGFGIERLPDEAQRRGLQSWLDGEIRPMFDMRVLPVTEDIIVRWRVVSEAGKKSGYTYTFSEPDS